MKSERYALAWFRRACQSLLGGALASILVAVVDSTWARAQWNAGPPLVSDLFQILLADAGLVALLGLALSCAVAVMAIFFSPHERISPKLLVAELRIRAIGRPADIAAFVPLLVLAAFLWTTLLAQLARIILAIDAPALVIGTMLSASALVLALVFSLAILVLTPPLRRALATAASEGARVVVDPAVTGFSALFIVALLLGIGVALGNISGEGGGLFGIYGILKRPELDLRAPTAVLFIAVAACFGPSFFGRFRSLVALAIALSPIALTLRAADALNTMPAVSTALERGAPIGKLVLAAVRRGTDVDHDGASGRFGGGDCNDSDPNVNPLGIEIANNGIDEDCSGADLTRVPTPLAIDHVAKTTAKVRSDLNVVLITVDTLRADVGFLGYPRAVSPNLDALAKKSVVFERAYSLASYTGKSVGPMLIGKYGSETHRNWGHFNRFGPEDTFVAERLSRERVHTMSVQGHRYFGKFGGLDRGFDIVDLSAAPPEDAKWDVSDKSSSDKLTDAAIGLLAKPENTQGRFFLWIHYLDPHADYLRHKDVPDFGLNERDIYDGEIAFTDKHIGRLLDAIQAGTFRDRTAIIVTSDHGEAFGEHKMWRHGFELWEELVRVPLLIYLPDARPHRIAARRSAIDLVPTILDLFSAPKPTSPDEAADAFLSGVSLLPDVMLMPGGREEPRTVLIDMPAGPYNDARRAMISGDRKLTISNGTRFELYNLEADPGETKNLWDRPEERRSAEAEYADMKARLREIRVTGERKQ